METDLGLGGWVEGKGLQSGQTCGWTGSNPVRVDLRLEFVFFLFLIFFIFFNLQMSKTTEKTQWKTMNSNEMSKGFEEIQMSSEDI